MPRQYISRSTTYTCCVCGIKFEAKGIAKFCPECRPEHKRLKQLERAAKSRAKRRGAKKMPVCTCVICGSVFIAGKRGTKYCPNCRVIRNRETARARFEHHPRPPHNAQKPYTCERCGAGFLAGRKSRLCPSCRARYVYVPRTCSCGYVFPKRHIKCPVCNPPKSGKRWKITDTRRLAIYERDGWTCWLCGLPVDRGDDPKSGRFYPTLDHVIPRCDGGDHSDENLRCAHRSCNSSRGSRAA